MASLYRLEPIVQRRHMCSVLMLLGFGACTGVWAENSAIARPALERFIHTAKLPYRSRIWAKDFAKVAKSPNHPLYVLTSQIQTAKDSDLLALLVQTFQNLSEEDANELVALLETTQGQWIVQSSLWAQEFVLSRPAERKPDPLKDSEITPRRLSNTETRAIKAIGSTPPWQALRRVGNASLLGSELMMALDWPLFVDLTQDPAQR